MNTQKKVLIVGKAFYINACKPNKDGKYGIGISSPECHINKNAENIAILKETMEKFIKRDDKTNLDVIQVRNAKFPLKVFDKDNVEIENARISNGTNVQAVCSFKWDSERNKFFLTVDGLKILDDYKAYHPFENDIEFE